jgi:hypothetical protein
MLPRARRPDGRRGGFDQRNRARQRRAAAGAEVSCQFFHIDRRVIRQGHALVYNGSAR